MYNIFCNLGVICHLGPARMWCFFGFFIIIILHFRVQRETNRVRNLKFATYLKFATCENTNKIYELW